MCSNNMANAHVTFEVNQTKIKGGCQLGRKVVIHNYMSDLPLEEGEKDKKFYSDKLRGFGDPGIKDIFIKDFWGCRILSASLGSKISLILL